MVEVIELDLGTEQSQVEAYTKGSDAEGLDLQFLHSFIHSFICSCQCGMVDWWSASAPKFVLGLGLPLTFPFTVLFNFDL